MRQQPSKKAITISTVLTALILLGVAATSLSAQGWSLAVTNPTQSEEANSAGEMALEAALDPALAEEATLASGTALDPALEAALDASLDPNMDPALKESLKSALRSALSPQNLAAMEGQSTDPAFVVTVEPIYLPGQQQAAVSGAQMAAPAAQWSGQSAPAAVSAPAASAPSNDQVAAAYQAQLEEAYAALQDAYTQIDTLQNPPATTVTTVSYGGEYEEEHEEHEEHGDHDDDHDEHEEDEYDD